MKNVGIFPNLQKEGALSLTGQMVSWLEDRGVQVRLPSDVSGLLSREDLGVISWDAPLDLVLVLGGDGTLLNAAKSVAPSGAPILGVNLGHLGFLTEIEIGDLFEALPPVLAGRFLVEERMMLEASVVRGDRRIAGFFALNEIVVAKGAFARLIRLEVRINGDVVDTYSADGVIVATPTGSTAYSLSAGGPIVEPDLGVMIVTPICPHTLHWRSLVIDSSREVIIRLDRAHPETSLTVDGQLGFQLDHGDEVAVTCSATSVRLVRLSDRSFYQRLTSKLKEG